MSERPSAALFLTIGGLADLILAYCMLQSGANRVQFTIMLLLMFGSQLALLLGILTIFQRMVATLKQAQEQLINESTARILALKTLHLQIKSTSARIP